MWKIITRVCILDLLFRIFFSQPSFASLSKKEISIFASHLLLWLECYLSQNYNLTLPTVSSLSCPPTKSGAFLDNICLSTAWNTSRFPVWQYLLRYFMSAKIFLFSTTFFKAKNDVESVLSHFRSLSSCPCSYLWSNFLSFQEWIPRIWFTILSHFSLISSSLLIELAQHHQRWLIIALKVR